MLLKLREEVIVLKGLDLGSVAERQLLRRLGRVKRITDSPAYGHLYGGKELEGPRHEAEANVVARLMNSGPVIECLPRIVESVLDVLGLEKTPAAKSRGRKDRVVNGGVSDPVQAQANPLTRAEDDEWSGSESAVEDQMSLDDDDDADPENGIKLDNLVQVEQDGGDVDMGGSSDFSGFSARVAASSDEDSEDARSDSGALPEKITFKGTTPERRLKPETKISPSVGSPSPEPKKKAKPKVEATPPSSTAFLPSLMMGGYYSGSESASDIEDTHIKPRKNRRGQRARQKIAEAKFGAGAKHIAKQSSGRNNGWDPKRGATDGMVNSKGRMRIGRPVNSMGPSGANGDVLGAKKKEVVRDGPVHPSWEAARKRKEQGSKISIDVGGGGMGKKITFD